MVAYQVLGFFSPLGKTTWTAGATVPVKFALADVNGVRIGDAEAQSIINNCDAKVTLTGTPSPNCFGYDATADAFQFDLATAKTLNGSYAITATITKTATVLNTKSVTIDIRRS